MNLDADIVREVERSLRLLGVSNAEIAAMDTANPQAFYEVIERAGGKSDVLRFIGSYRDTLSNEDVLDGLKHWNDLFEDLTLREGGQPSR